MNRALLSSNYAWKRPCRPEIFLILGLLVKPFGAWCRENLCSGVGFGPRISGRRVSRVAMTQEEAFRSTSSEPFLEPKIMIGL